MKATIHRNWAKCRVCEATIESFTNDSYETCNCGSIAITGGKERIKRLVRSWADLEELSEYLLTWRDVLDCKGWCKKLEDAEANAQMTEHLFFVFDGRIYQTSIRGKAKDTGKLTEELDSPVPCLVRA